MITELYFEQKSLPYNFMVGGCVRVNQNNGRYAWHRVVGLYQWIDKTVTIYTVELKADWTDGDHHAWKDDKVLIDRMNLTTVEMIGTGFAYNVRTASHWEHDVLEPFVEQYHVHLN